MNSKPKDVCLVDDDEEVREVFSMFIEEHYPSVHVTEVGSAIKAFDILIHNKFDLLITDLKMPEMDGNELIRRLEEHPDQRPEHILVLTGFLGEIEDDSTHVKNISYLTKPFKENVFKAFMRKTLGLVDQEIIDQKNEEEMEEIDFTKEKAVQSELQFIEPFIDTTINFIQKISKRKVEKVSTHIRTAEKEEEHLFTGNIGSILNMTSPFIKGSMGICFEGNSYLDIFNQFNKSKEKAISHQNGGFAGHILKKIMVQAKSQLNELGYQLETSVPPGIYFGNELTLHHFYQGPVLVTTFQTKFGRFSLELMFKGTKRKSVS